MLVHQGLKRVIGRVGHWHFPEDASEYRNPVRRTARTRGGFAKRRRGFAQSHQPDWIRIGTSYTRHGTIGQVKGDARGNGTGRNRIGTVSSKRTAIESRDLIQVETGLWVAEILVQAG